MGDDLHMKPWLLITIAGITFVLVWSVVIFQFVQLSKPALDVAQNTTIDRTNYTKTSEVPNVVVDNVEMEEVSLEDTARESNSGYALRDLRSIDLSDVDTKDGVPLDILLNRLGLN